MRLNIRTPKKVKEYRNNRWTLEELKTNILQEIARPYTEERFLEHASASRKIDRGWGRLLPTQNVNR